MVWTGKQEPGKQCAAVCSLSVPYGVCVRRRVTLRCADTVVCLDTWQGGSSGTLNPAV